MRVRLVFQSTISYVVLSPLSSFFRAVAAAFLVDGVDTAADDTAGDGELEGRLDAVGRAVGVRGAFEGLLEGLQVTFVGDLGFAAGQFLGFQHGQPQLFEAGLDPGVEAGAPAGGGLRGAWHGAGEFLGEAVRVGGQAQQLGRGQGHGQGDVGDALRGRAGALR